MSAEFYKDMQATAASLVQEFGTAATLKRYTGRVIDPVAGNVTTEGATEAMHTFAVLTNWQEGEADGKRIFLTDQKVVLSGKIPVQKGDEIIMAGKKIGAIVELLYKNPTMQTDIVFIAAVRA